MGPKEKLALRYVLTSVFWLGIAGIEGVLMRFRLGGILTEIYDPKHFYGMMTVHPFIGIYGWAYMAVIGAFYYLVPYVLKKELYSKKVANISYWMIVSGVLITWIQAFSLTLHHSTPFIGLYR